MVWCHNLSVDYWYRVKKSQQLVSRFLKRCSKELCTDKDEKAQSWTDENETPLETVCFYTEEQDLKTHFDGDVEVRSSTQYEEKLEVEDTGKEEFSLGEMFAGFFLTNGSFRIVKSVSIAQTTVKITIYSNSQSIQSGGVCKVLEMVVFNQLKAKCNFLETLLTSTEQSDDKSMEIRHIVEGLIGDIIALFNRSTIEKILHPNIPELKSKTVSDKVAQGLFKIDQSIKGAGYRYSTLQIDIVVEQDETNRENRDIAIQKYLSEEGIEKFELCYVSPNETLFTHAGAKCHAYGEIGTLGCFAYKTDNEGLKKLCALVSRHVAIEAFKSDKKVDLDGRALGTVLKSTTTKPDYDIAAVIADPYIEHNRDLYFRNVDKNLVLGQLYKPVKSDDDYQSLQNMEVYIWGGTRMKEDQPGFGKIIIPKYISSSCPLPQVKVMDIYTNQRMAFPGDSGGIMCIDSLEDDTVILIAMLKGSTEDDEEIEANPCRKREYVTFLLRDGLEQLEQQTKCQFELASST